MQLGVLALVAAVSVLGGGTAAGMMAQASGGSPMVGTMGGGMGGMHGGGMMGDGNCDVGQTQNGEMNCDMQMDHEQCREMMS